MRIKIVHFVNISEETLIQLIITKKFDCIQKVRLNSGENKNANRYKFWKKRFLLLLTLLMKMSTLVHSNYIYHSKYILVRNAKHFYDTKSK